MRKLSLFLTVSLLAVVSCSKEFDDSQIWDKLNDHESRIDYLETLCDQMNTNIKALQTTVKALQDNDYVTNVAPITSGGKEIGYTITFLKSGSVTIYHGKDGAKGEQGDKGQTGDKGDKGDTGEAGATPVVGVAKDTDGVYYWTLNGSWLVDESGHKIPTTGKDGAQGPQGEQGVQGEQGIQGEAGKDGITPQLKIEDGRWLVSYDSGEHWTDIGQATGDQGPQGETGATGPQGPQGEQGYPGVSGDSMFTDINYSNSDYVLFTLSNGKQFKVPTWSAFEALKKQCEQMNSNIEALQTVVAALQDNDYVTSVTPIYDGVTEIGYIINFSKGGKATIYHGKDGAKGEQGDKGETGEKGDKGDTGEAGATPVVGVAKDTDGVYYWTLNGSWLVDESGNKIPTTGKDGAQGLQGEQGVQGEQGIQGEPGKDGITPQLKIEDGRWLESYDDGEHWMDIGQATGDQGPQGEQGVQGETGKDGDSFFQDVTEDKRFVYLILADGSTITLHKSGVLDITFAEDDTVVVLPNSTCEINYIVISDKEHVTVETTCSSDIKAKIASDDVTGKVGKVMITLDDVIDEYSRVIVFVSDGDKVVMKSISFEKAGLTITDGADKVIGAEGGNVLLNFTTNMDWKISIPADAEDWIALEPQTKAMETYTQMLKVRPNASLSERSAKINITSSDGELSVFYTIIQKKFDNVWITIPDNEGWHEEDAVSIFAGNTKNQKFLYAGEVGVHAGKFTSTVLETGFPSQVNALYAIYPYKISHALDKDGIITTVFPHEQDYVEGGFRRDYNMRVGVSADLADTSIDLYPLCAYLSVKLWGEDHTVKSVSITSKGGESLAGAAVISPLSSNVPSFELTGTIDNIRLNCGGVQIGTSEDTATEFYIVVPAVTLSTGYDIKIEEFFGGEQIVHMSTSEFIAGETYIVSSEVTITRDGPGVGVGGWGDGGENGGSAE